MHLWDQKHPYYSSDGNYHNNNWTFRFTSWADFRDVWGGADEDYNLVFRWDWRVSTDSNELPTEVGKRGDGELQICYVLQRKGCYATCFVKVRGEDEAEVRAWLSAKWEHMKRIWSPVS